ncbi:hypothetical protein K2X30_10845 [bacterium]|nr:hypothetical protein [bacterium]
MSRIIVIGGIESTYSNAQVLHSLGEEILLLVTRGPQSPGWEGVDMIDESQFPFSSQVKKLTVQRNINDHIAEFKSLKPDFIYSLGWQQVYSKELLSICPVIGIHESLLPEGAGPTPIANVILHDVPRTGVSLFWLDGGMDTGPLIGQLCGNLDPREANATDLYREAMELEKHLLEMYVPQIRSGRAPSIPQDFSKRTTYQKLRWENWPSEKVARARVYPYA